LSPSLSLTFLLFFETLPSEFCAFESGHHFAVSFKYTAFIGYEALNQYISVKLGSWQYPQYSLGFNISVNSAWHVNIVGRYISVNIGIFAYVDITFYFNVPLIFPSILTVPSVSILPSKKVFTPISVSKTSGLEFSFLLTCLTSLWQLVIWFPICCPDTEAGLQEHRWVLLQNADGDLCFFRCCRPSLFYLPFWQFVPLWPEVSGNGRKCAKTVPVVDNDTFAVIAVPVWKSNFSSGWSQYCCTIVCCNIDAFMYFLGEVKGSERVPKRELILPEAGQRVGMESMYCFSLDWVSLKLLRISASSPLISSSLSKMPWVCLYRL